MQDWQIYGPKKTIFRSQKTYDIVMEMAKNIENMSTELSHRARDYHGSLEPQHEMGNTIDEEVNQEDFDRLEYLIDSLDTEMKAMHKALEAHRQSLEDEREKARKCYDCIHLHDPIMQCEAHEDDEFFCVFKIVDPRMESK
jgi:hypothetical protein